MGTKAHASKSSKKNNQKTTTWFCSNQIRVGNKDYPTSQVIQNSRQLYLISTVRTLLTGPRFGVNLQSGFMDPST